MSGRQRRHAYVHRPARHAQGDATILRQPLFGNIQLCHDLDTRNNDAMERLRWFQNITQYPVYAQTRHRARLERLDMYIGGTVAHCLCEQRVYQAHDRRVVFAF